MSFVIAGCDPAVGVVAATLTYTPLGSYVPFQPNDAAACCDRDGCSAIFRSELLQDPAAMDLHGGFGNAQEFSDIAASVSLAKTQQNLCLARSQAIVAHVLGERRRHFRRDSLPAGVHFADRLEQFTGRHAF